MRRFIEMCFEPGSPVNAKLKEMLLSIAVDDDQPKNPRYNHDAVNRKVVTHTKAVICARYSSDKQREESIEYQRQIIDTFIDAIYVYDARLVFTCNFQDGSATITPEEIEEPFPGADEAPVLFHHRLLTLLGGFLML